MYNQQQNKKRIDIVDPLSALRFIQLLSSVSNGGRYTDCDYGGCQKFSYYVWFVSREDSDQQ